MLDCGHHKCETVCHPGKCSTCPLALPVSSSSGYANEWCARFLAYKSCFESQLQRTCPCGKKSVTVACTSEVGGCGDTCGKLLECGIHECAERCHKGKCGTVSFLFEKLELFNLFLFFLKRIFFIVFLCSVCKCEFNHAVVAWKRKNFHAIKNFNAKLNASISKIAGVIPATERWITHIFVFTKIGNEEES